MAYGKDIDDMDDAPDEEMDDGDGDFLGQIDDVRIYNRALSASEINQIYTNTDV